MPDVCFIQQYVDTLAGEAAEDYRCGPLSYDDHGGTDIRVRTMAEMEAGVAVIAAAPGVVKGLRDGMAERGLPTIIDVVVTRDPTKMLPGVDNRAVQAKKGDRIA